MGMRVCPKPFGPGYYRNFFSGQNEDSMVYRTIKYNKYNLSVSKDGGLAPTFKKRNLGI
jgi:hypothetical protein